MKWYGKKTPIVDINTPKEEVRSKVRNAIHDYFKNDLGRPELLNRIGENIIVFDFIDEEVAEEILNAKLEKIRDSILSNNGIDIDYKPILPQLLEKAKAKECRINGGRGINNMVEKDLINPLARHIFDDFDDHVENGKKMVVTKILFDRTPVDLEWEEQKTEQGKTD